MTDKNGKMYCDNCFKPVDIEKDRYAEMTIATYKGTKSFDVSLFLCKYCYRLMLEGLTQIDIEKCPTVDKGGEI